MVVYFVAFDHALLTHPLGSSAPSIENLFKLQIKRVGIMSTCSPATNLTPALLHLDSAGVASFRQERMK